MLVPRVFDVYLAKGSPLREHLEQVADLAHDDEELLEQHKELIEILAMIARRVGCDSAAKIWLSVSSDGMQLY